MSERRPQCIRQQRGQRLELHVGRRGGLLVRPVQRPGGKPCLAVDQLGNPGIDGLRGDDAPRGDRFGLPDAVAAVDGLGLLVRRSRTARPARCSRRLAGSGPRQPRSASTPRPPRLGHSRKRRHSTAAPWASGRHGSTRSAPPAGRRSLRRRPSRRCAWRKRRPCRRYGPAESRSPQPVRPSPGRYVASW